MSAMTLESVRDWHRIREASFAQSTSTLFSKEHARAKIKHRKMADAIDAHLTHPAQSVDEPRLFSFSVDNRDTVRVKWPDGEHIDYTRTAALTEKGNG